MRRNWLRLAARLPLAEKPPAGYATPPYLDFAAVGRAPTRRLEIGEALLSWGNTPVPSAGGLALATGPLVTEASTPPWDLAFADREDAAALHRFAWLLPWLVQGGAAGWARDEAVSLVRAAIAGWIAARGAQSDPVAWQPYTVGERLVNWTLAALALGDDFCSDDVVAESLRAQARYLAGHLEYYGERFTGNHLSHNGRGLYIAGLWLGEPGIAEIGRQILLHERSRLFREPWFASEGSSHYQFLIARNYGEALWFATQTGDQALAGALEPLVTDLGRGCEFFLVSGGDGRAAIPLFGDISPDCRPEWLCGVPWVLARLTGGDYPRALVPHGVGWHRMFERVLPADVTQTREAPIDSREWARLEKHDWIAIAHVNPAGYPRGHAHQDTGAFVAYRGATAVLVDAGRLTYRDTEEGRWGRSARAHSLLTVDDASPAPEWHWAYPDSLMQQISGDLPIIKCSGETLTIEHGGFGRVRAGHHRRMITLSPASIVIADQLDGAGIHSVRLRWHVAGEPDTADAIRLADGTRVHLESPGDVSVRQVVYSPHGTRSEGWASSAYGEARPITTVTFTGRVRLPWSGTTSLTVECAA